MKRKKKEDLTPLAEYFTSPTDNKVKILHHLIVLCKGSPKIMHNMLANYIESIDTELAEAWLDVKLEDNPT